MTFEKWENIKEILICKTRPTINWTVEKTLPRIMNFLASKRLFFGGIANNNNYYETSKRFSGAFSKANKSDICDLFYAAVNNNNKNDHYKENVH